MPREALLAAVDPRGRLGSIESPAQVALHDGHAARCADDEVLGGGVGALDLPRTEQASKLGEEGDHPRARLALRPLRQAVREQAPRDGDRVRGEHPELASYLRIEKRELETGGLN
jgi:hypothetical protein